MAHLRPRGNHSYQSGAERVDVGQGFLEWVQYPGIKQQKKKKANEEDTGKNSAINFGISNPNATASTSKLTPMLWSQKGDMERQPHIEHNAALSNT